MLQQTRVETVLPYYERFLARFPTVEALAAAPVEEVLALWSGLGYYRRARQLHAAAREVALQGGRFPPSLAGLRALPGIGEYTAAAVGSIAFGLVEPVLDGNVERVVSRLLALEESAKGGEARRRLRAAAAELLLPERPGDGNQALMELGATICTPRRPRCLLCPLVEGCRGARSGEPERFPAPRARRAVERLELLAAVVEEGGRVLLVRRPDGAALLAGTWEVPWVEVESGGSEVERRAEALLARRYGGRWRLLEAVGQVRHGITFRDLQVAVYRAEVKDGGALRDGVEGGWFGAAERTGLPLSSLVGKVLGAGEVSPGRPARRSPSRRR